MAMLAHPHPDQRDDHTGHHQRQIADGRKVTEHKGNGTDDDGHRAGQSIFAQGDGRAAFIAAPKALKSYFGTGLFAIIIHPITFYCSPFFLDMSTLFY